MLNDNFPTNIFSISELPTFGFTRYSYSCSTRQYSRQLNADGRTMAGMGGRSRHGGPSHQPSSHQESDPLLASFVSLLQARIPCEWRYSEAAQFTQEAGVRPKKSSTIDRDLWVFWLNDQSQLQDHGLERLTECQSGVMAWDSILQTNTSISIGSPQTPRPNIPIGDTFNSLRGYEILISGLRNVLDRGLLARGGYRLGDSYVFPSSQQPKLSDFILPSFPKTTSMTMLSCDVAIYLSSSNLVFQPSFQHHRLRTLDIADLQHRPAQRKGLQVVLSPHGTQAILQLKETVEFTEQQIQDCLDEWAHLYGVGDHYLDDMSSMLPRLVPVCVKSGQNEVVLQYPTERVFVPISRKESPSDVGQLDGMGSRNLGFIEDLGAKFALWSWQEKTRNAIVAPAVPKLVQPTSEHTPILAEPRKKAGSSAWHQQQQLLQQQQQQQQQVQQQQQQQQAFFLQQQDAVFRRETSAPTVDINRIDYWSYTDPHGYLTSIVLNSCANVEPKGVDSPSTMDQQSSLAPASHAKTSKSKSSAANTKDRTENDGWIRKRPKKPVDNYVPQLLSADILDSGQNAWADQLPVGSAESASADRTFDTPDGLADPGTETGDQGGAQEGNTVGAASYSAPAGLPVDNGSSDMMSDLMGMDDSLSGMFGGGNNDDLDFGDWGEVTKADFSFFDDQPQMSAPVPSAPLPPPPPLATTMVAPLIQSSVPPTSAIGMTVISQPTSVMSASGLMAAFSSISDPYSRLQTTESPMNDDALFMTMNMNMDLDLSSFTQPTPPSSAIMTSVPADRPLGSQSRIDDFTSQSPAGDAAFAQQPLQDISMLTPTPLGGLSELIDQRPSSTLDQPHSSQFCELSLAKKTSPALVIEHVLSPTQSFIPSTFSPLKLVGVYIVDESKYREGGQYMYRRLYKRRTSGIRDKRRQESRMLPFYQPGQIQEWIAPPVNERERSKSRKVTLARRAIVKQEEIDSKMFRHGGQQHGKLVLKQEFEHGAESNGSSNFWGISLLTPKKKSDPDSTSSSESDASSESSTSDSDNEPGNVRPTFGSVSVRSDIASMTPWTLRSVNSAKFVASILAPSKDRAVGGALLGMPPPPANSQAISGSTAARPLTASNWKPWDSAESYHADVEFDTPFTPAIMASAPPALVKEPPTIHGSLATGYFLEAVRVLCEQAIMGAYPFGGSNEVTGTSGEISEGESFHAMIARRKTMMESLLGGVATVPGLGDESFRNVMEMRAIIFDIFDHFRGNPTESTILPIPSDASQDMGLASLHSHHQSQSQLTPTVAMKGPLTLFQYFSLAEARPMPSKYGKYQVKKRKPAEPSLLQLQPPDIVVGHCDEWLEASPTILRFWEKLSLEPYAARKNISYFVVYPEGVDMENSVTKLWRELSVVFESSLLGTHQPGNLQDYKPGLVPIPLLPAHLGESLEARQVRSYVDGCQKLGSILGGMSQRDIHTVIYMVNPFSHGAGYFDLCRCFSIMKTQFRTAARGSLLTPAERERDRLVLQIVPIQHVLYPAAFGGYLRFGLKDIAFTVYTKCKMFLERPTYSEEALSQINAYAPSFALAKTTPSTIHFDVHQKPNSVPKVSATLHVGYGFSLDGRWLICVWTDHRGEMLEHMALDMTLPKMMLMSGLQDRSMTVCLQEIWARTLIYQKRGSFSWKTVISKLGLMSRPELAEWIRLTEGTAHTSIVAVNIDSPLRVYPHNRGADCSLAMGATPCASGVNTPNTASANVGAGGVAGMGTPTGSLSSSTNTPMGMSGSGPGMNSSSSTTVSTPATSTAPTTPLSAGGYVGSNGGLNAGTTGLGIGIAGSASGVSGVGGGANVGGSLAGIGGMSAHETLENSAGQMYAMILNHRIPLIVSRQEMLCKFGEPRSGSSGHDAKDVAVGSTPMATPVETTDEEMAEPKMKQEEVEGSMLKQTMSQGGKDGLGGSSLGLSDNDVILPLATGYLLQVPILSNSVMREKHCLETLGIEVHLLHLQRPGSFAGPSSLDSSGISTAALMSGSTALGSAGGYNSHQQHVSSPYLQHSGSSFHQHHQHLHHRPPPTSPSFNQVYRAPTFNSPYSSTSSAVAGFGNLNSSSTSNGGGANTGGGAGNAGGAGGGSGLGIGIGIGGGTLNNNNSSNNSGSNNSAGGHSTGQIQSQGGTKTMAIKSTVASNVTREILKEFHALSFLSMAPVETNCLPNHLVLLERLSRVLLLVQE